MFYDRFVGLCKEREVSPSAVMVSIGLNKSNATFWKKGSIPKGDTLQKLADYFGVSVDYLLSGGEQISQTHLANGIHVYRNTSLYGVDPSVLDDLPENSYDVKYQDKHIIVAINKDAAISEGDLEKIIDEYKNSMIDFGSELEKIFELESKRLAIPVETLKMAFLKRKNDGSRPILNHENISFFFDSIYGQNRKPENRVLSALNKLNLFGQQEAVKRVEELTEIPRYRRQDAPQSPPAPQEGGTPEGSEGAQEGE